MISTIGNIIVSYRTHSIISTEHTFMYKIIIDLYVAHRISLLHRRTKDFIMGGSLGGGLGHRVWGTEPVRSRGKAPIGDLGDSPPKLKQNVKLAYDFLTFFCTTFRI